MKKIVLSILLIISWSTFANAQDINFNYKEVQPAQFFITQPFENVNGKIIITAEINGKPGRFLLDTGAPNLISTTLAQTLKAKSLSNTKAKDANGNSEALSVVDIEQLKIGDVVFKHIPTVVSNSFILGCFNLDGIIGSNIFDHAILRLNGKEKTVILTNNQTKVNYDKNKAITLSIPVKKQALPFVELQLNGATDQVLFDLGYNGLYMITNAKFQDFNKKGVFTKVEQGFGSNAVGISDKKSENNYYRTIIPEFKIGTTVLKGLIAESTAGTSSTLGAKLLDYGDITLDYIDKKFCFEADQDNLTMPNKVWPITPNIQNGKFIIGVVWDNEIRKSIKPGYQIMKINDLNYENPDLCQILSTPSPLAKEDTKTTLTLKDDKGKSIVVEIFKNEFNINP